MNANLRKTIGQITVALFTTLALAALTPRAFAQGGVPLWTNRYNGLANGDDRALAIAVDRSNNVFVTGSSAATNGVGDYATIKYSSAGVPLWTNFYNGPANSGEVARAVTVDNAGNVIVAGNSSSLSVYPFNGDYLTIKYSSAGVGMWTNRHRFTSGGSYIARAVAVDSNDNVFVAGSVSGGTPATIAYSSTGVPLWTNRYNGGFAVAVGSNGNVFVTGYDSTGPATVAYSNAGFPLWTNSFGGDNAIAFDSHGNLFVTAFSGMKAAWETYSFSSAGVPIWTNYFPSLSSETTLAMDGRDNVIVTGNVWNGSNYDRTTIKYSNAGVPLWTNFYNGPTNRNNIFNEAGVAIATDSNGSVFVTGTSLGTNGFTEITTVAYSAVGVPVWTNRYHGLGNGDDQLSAIAVDSGGNVLVTGYSNGSGSGLDYVTIKYSPTVVPIHLAIEREGSGGLFLRYTGAPDVSYRLERAPSLSGTWSNLATNTAPASGLIEYHETSPPPGQSFYRTVQP